MRECKRNAGNGLLSRREGGSYLVEAAMAILGVAVFVVGVSDVSRVFHARGAVRAGVSEGLRCVYPNDPQCSSASLPNGDTLAARFDVFADVSSGYLIDRSDYSISTTMFNEPALEAALQAPDLERVEVSQPQSSFAQSNVLYPVRANSPYVLMTQSLPRVDGSEPLSPSFRDPYTNASRPADEVLDISTVSEKNVTLAPNFRDGRDEYDRVFRIGASESFDMAKAWSGFASDAAAIASIQSKFGVSVPCYDGRLSSSSTEPRILWPSGSLPSACSYRSTNIWSNSSIRVPVMLHISGRVIDTDSDAEGEIVARLRAEWPGGRIIKELGGRAFKGSGSGDFVVRGATWSDIDKDVRSEYLRYKEIDLYGTLPLIPLNAKVWVEFFLSSVNEKPVGWQGESIKVFFPKFDFVQESYACQYSKDPSTCSNPPANVKVLYRDVDLSKGIKTAAVASPQCSRTSPRPLESSTTAVITRITKDLQAGKKASAYSFFVAGDSSPGCEAKVNTFACTKDQPQKYYDGCEVPTYSDDSIVSSCGVTDFQKDKDSIVKVVYADSNAGSESRWACTEESFPACAKTVQGGSRLLGGSAGGCGVAIDISPTVGNEGPLFDSICTDVGDEVEKRYRDRHLIPDAISTELQRSPAEPLYSAKPPTDPCVSYLEVSSGSGSGTGAQIPVLRGVTRAVAERYCSSFGPGACRFVELPPSSTNGGIGGSGSFAPVFSAAMNRVLDTVQTAYPPADSPETCLEGDANCLQIQAEPADDNAVRIQARMAVPLTLASLIGLDGVTVEYEEKRVLERALLEDLR